MIKIIVTVLLCILMLSVLVADVYNTFVKK